MRLSSISKFLGNASGLALLLGAFASCAFSAETCNMETFKGPYALTVTGFVLPPLSFGVFGFTGGEAAVPIQGVQLITSDGRGHLTDKESLSLNGEPLAATEANPFSLHYGTYTVDSDCTGTAFLTNAKYVCPAGETTCDAVSSVHLAFIIDTAGKKIRMVGVPPYDSGGTLRVVSSIGDKITQSEPFSF